MDRLGPSIGNRQMKSDKPQADAAIAESLFNRARGYTHEATKIFMPAGSEAPVYAPYVKHYPGRNDKRSTSAGPSSTG